MGSLSREPGFVLAVIATLSLTAVGVYFFGRALVDAFLTKRELEADDEALRLLGLGRGYEPRSDHHVHVAVERVDAEYEAQHPGEVITPEAASAAVRRANPTEPDDSPEPADVYARAAVRIGTAFNSSSERMAKAMRQIGDAIGRMDRRHRNVRRFEAEHPEKPTGRHPRPPWPQWPVERDKVGRTPKTPKLVRGEWVR